MRAHICWKWPLNSPFLRMSFLCLEANISKCLRNVSSWEVTWGICSTHTHTLHYRVIHEWTVDPLFQSSLRHISPVTWMDISISTTLMNQKQLSAAITGEVYGYPTLSSMEWTRCKATKTRTLTSLSFFMAPKPALRLAIFYFILARGFVSKQRQRTILAFNIDDLFVRGYLRFIGYIDPVQIMNYYMRRNTTHTYTDNKTKQSYKGAHKYTIQCSNNNNNLTTMTSH